MSEPDNYSPLIFYCQLQDAQKCQKIFTTSKVPELEIISTARITVNRVLVEGDYVFIFVEGAIRVGQGMFAFNLDEQCPTEYFSSHNVLEGWQ